MRKLIYSLKMYDYSTDKEAQKDISKMREKGYCIQDQYQAEEYLCSNLL